MNLHIELDKSHPAYAWLEKQADKIGARGHFGTHIDCYTSVPSQNEFVLPAFIIDCRLKMPTCEEAARLPLLQNKALILYTGNLYSNGYGTKAYFDETDTSVEDETLRLILERSPRLILIDSYGIGQHGPCHQERDKLCESFGCYVIENICIAPQQVDEIHTIRVNFDLEYPSTGKPCTVSY